MIGSSSWASLTGGPWNKRSWASLTGGPCNKRSWASLTGGPCNKRSWASVTGGPCNKRSWAAVMLVLAFQWCQGNPIIWVNNDQILFSALESWWILGKIIPLHPQLGLLDLLGTPYLERCNITPNRSKWSEEKGSPIFWEGLSHPFSPLVVHHT